MQMTVYKENNDTYTVDAVSGKFMQVTVPYVKDPNTIRFEKSGYIILDEHKNSTSAVNTAKHIIDIKDTVEFNDGSTYNIENIEQMGKFFNDFITRASLEGIDKYANH